MKNAYQLVALLSQTLKRNALPCFLFVMGFGGFASGTLSAKEYPIPEFLNKPAYYNEHDASLVSLERSPYQPLVKARALGLGGGTAGFFLEGPASPVRITASANLEFMLKVTPGVDPETILDLGQFTIKDGKRIFITTKIKLLSADSTSYAKIPYGIKKTSEGVYLLSMSNLKPGEYFLGSADYMFAFGIDNPPPAKKSD